MDQKPSVIFLIYHGISHFNSCFRIARNLQEKYCVIFAGVEFFNNYVSSQGFVYFPLKTVPFGIGLESWMNEIGKKKPQYLFNLIHRWSDRLYHLREKELKWMIDEISPAHIVLDVQQSTDFIVLYQLIKDRNIKLSILHTMFPTALVIKLPPLNSLALPDDKVEIEKAHRKLKRSRFKRKWNQKLKYLGMDNTAIIRRRIGRNGIPSQYVSGQISLFPFNTKQIQEFILAPRELDFPQSGSKEFQHYIGSQIDFNRKETADQQYLHRSASIYGKLKDGECKLIYCSFGTVPPENKKALLSFLQRLINALPLNALLLISFAATSEEMKFLRFDSEKVYIFRIVPQLEVLSKADLFITHGGLNSIKEAIFAEVAMLVYPITADYDQPGNSSRVVFHQLGLRGDMMTDTVDQIQSKIDNLLANSMYKENLSKLKTINNSYSIGNFIEMIT